MLAPFLVFNQLIFGTTSISTYCIILTLCSSSAGWTITSLLSFYSYILVCIAVLYVSYKLLEG